MLENLGEPLELLLTNSDVYVDQMHQPWRTFGAIINKCLSGKIMRIDRLCSSRIEILWEEIKDSNAYKMFFGYSTGLIPLKKGISRGELKNTQVSRKIRTSRAVVIQKPPSVPVKRTQKSSSKLKGIEMLSEATQLELVTQKAIKDSRRASRLKNKNGSSSEGTSVSPGVLDELKRVSTDEETNKDDDEDDTNEEDEEESFSKEAENKEESFSEEENVDEGNEEESDDDDKSFDITNIDDERTESDSDDHGIAKEGKTEEPKGDDQAKEAEVGVLELVTSEEKSKFLQSTSSHSISLNFGNQFLVNSPNASLIGTTPKNADKEITSLMDIKIQQDVPLVQNEPFQKVKVSVIPEPTQQPPSTPPLPAIEDPVAPVIKFEAIDSFLYKFHSFEKDVQELKQVDPSTAILESIRSQVPSMVKDSLRSNIGDELQKWYWTFSNKMIWVSASKRLPCSVPFLSSQLLWNVFLSLRGCLTNLPLLLKNFLKSLTAMAYSSSSLPRSRNTPHH
ncbi:hypothetical protein Tco_0353026 [Tanacetum coccineum]